MKSKVKYTPEMVTPSRAKELLEINTDNWRKSLNMGRIESYAKEMRKGVWKDNGETVKVSESNILLDGQHRLHAILRSGCTVPLCIASGIGDDAKLSIDRGQPRTLSQWVTHTGISNANEVVAISRLCLAHQHGLWALKSYSKYYQSDSEIIEFAEENSDRIRDALAVARKVGSVASKSVVGAIVYLGTSHALSSQSATANWFCDGLGSGAGMDETDAPLIFRNMKLNERQGQKKVPYVDRMLLTLAWNRTVTGDARRTLRLILTGPTKTKPPEKVEVTDQ